jgi:hypothetical protein
MANNINDTMMFLDIRPLKNTNQPGIGRVHDLVEYDDVMERQVMIDQVASQSPNLTDPIEYLARVVASGVYITQIL